MDTNKFLEEIKQKAKNKLCLDFNTIIGNTLEDKVKTIYICLYRMKSLSKSNSAIVLDTLVTSPLIYALLEVTNNICPNKEILISNFPDLCYQGSAFNKQWNIFVHEKTYQEHHILMSRIINDKLDCDPDNLVKISLSNFLMSNPFGYYNI